MPDRALSLRPVDFGVLPGPQRTEERRRVRLQVLSREHTLSTESFPIASEQGVDHEPEAGQREEEQHPGQRRLGTSVLQDDVGACDQHISREQPAQCCKSSDYHHEIVPSARARSLAVVW